MSDAVQCCPECNAHWLTLPNGTLIVVPNHRLPRITEDDGKIEYLTKETLADILADYYLNKE